MLPQQRLAWFQIVVFATACATGCLLWLLAGGQTVLAAFGLLGLWGLSPLFVRRKKKEPGEVLIDERDREIVRRATLFGFAASYLAFVLVSMAIWFCNWMLHSNETVSVHTLTLPVWIAFAVAVVARAIAILVRYGREDADATD